MKLYRITTAVTGLNEPLVDWYYSDSREEAIEANLEDMHRYGIRPEATKTECVECDLETLKPIKA